MRGGTLFSGICAPEQATKTCAACKEQKPLGAFHRQPKAKLGRHAYCKPCFNDRYRGKRRRTTPPEHRRWLNIKTRYGMTREQYDALLEAQGGVCAICRAAVPQHIDHDHATGAVRGLLCHGCNVRLGGWDDADWRTRALAYLGLPK